MAHKNFYIYVDDLEMYLTFFFLTILMDQMN